MFKVVLLLKRHPEVPATEFTQRWLGRPPDGGALHAGVLRHVHNRTVGDDMPIENAPSAPFDGVDEYWFADAPAARAYFESPDFLDRWMAPREALLAQPPGMLSGAPTLIWQREVSRPSDPVKIITLPVRREGMMPEAFGNHWIHVHSMLALQGPRTKERLQRLEACPCDIDRMAVFPAAPFDGAGSIEFASREDLQAEFSSPHYRDVMAPDELGFTDPSRSCALMVEPFVVR